MASDSSGRTSLYYNFAELRLVSELAYTILMSVYHGTSCSELNECLSSLVAQTLSPDQVLIVQDGPVDDDLKYCIKRFAEQLPIKNLVFEKNCGLSFKFSALGVSKKFF